jgi:hypothetical protein
MLCVNQCTGHGECVYGFCKCHDGWYGADCSRKRAGQEMEQGAPPRASASTPCASMGLCASSEGRQLQLQCAKPLSWASGDLLLCLTILVSG